MFKANLPQKNGVKNAWISQPISGPISGTISYPISDLILFGFTHMFRNGRLLDDAVVAGRTLIYI